MPQILNLKHKIRNLQRGFSLVEVLLVVMIVVFIALLVSNLPQSIRTNGNSDHETLAKEIASQQLETLRAKTYDNIGGNGSTPISDSRLTQLPSSQGSVIIADCPASICTNNELVKQVTVMITWAEAKGSDSVKFMTLIGQGGLK